MGEPYPFAIRFQLASSVILGHRLTLDGILASLIFERTKDLEEAHTKIPLSRSHGVWAGSAALLETPAPARTVSIIQALKADIDITPDMIRPDKRGNYPRVESARGPYRNKMTSYTAYDANAVWFSGHGDMIAVGKLLADCHGVGTKRNVGYGKIEKFEIIQTDNNKSGISYSDGTPARPVPADQWLAEGGIDCSTSLETYCPPYWSGERVICALPLHRAVSRKQAAKLIFD